MAGKLINSILCYMEKDDCFLMLYRNKKPNDPCEGKWVGVGGKFEPGENADQCVIREVFEETGLKLTKYHFCGIIHFVSDTWPDEDMYLYTASGWEGEDNFQSGNDLSKTYEKLSSGYALEADEIFDCNEGELRWIPKSEVLQLNLWEGDKYFLKPLIAGKDNMEMTCIYEGHKCVRCF